MSMSTPPEGDESPPVEIRNTKVQNNKKDKRRNNLIATDLSDEFGKAASNSPFFMVGQDPELVAAVNNQPIALERLDQQQDGRDDEDETVQQQQKSHFGATSEFGREESCHKKRTIMRPEDLLKHSLVGSIQSSQRSHDDSELDIYNNFKRHLEEARKRNLSANARTDHFVDDSFQVQNQQEIDLGVNPIVP